MDRFTALTTLVRVVDAGSFSEAARQLNVGQPAVSKTIAHLEGRLGVRLLARTTHGLTPTEAGQRFYERARLAIENAEQADAAARGEGAGLTGLLRVAAATTFARLHVVPALPAFMAAHPALEVELVLDDRTIDLVGEGIDVSLRMGQLADSSAVARCIAASPRAVIASRLYLDRHGAPRTPAELAQHQAVVYTQQRAATWTFAQGSTEVSVAVSGRLRVSGAEGLRAAVIAGAGLAIASRWMFAPELASGEVCPVLADWTLPPVRLWAVYPTGRLASVKARAFVEHVATTLARLVHEGMDVTAASSDCGQRIGAVPRPGEASLDFPRFRPRGKGCP